MHPVCCAGVVCFKGDQVLLVKRGHVPLLNEWTIPGGKVKLNEPVTAAARRELMEETGIEATMIDLVNVVDGIFPESGAHYVLINHVAEWVAGEPCAADDVKEARFFDFDEALKKVDWDQTRTTILLAKANLEEDW